MSDRKRQNHLRRVLDSARDGVRELATEKLRHRCEPDQAMLFAKHEDEIAEKVVKNIRRHFTIRPRIPGS